MLFDYKKEFQLHNEGQVAILKNKKLKKNIRKRNKDISI